MAATVKEHVHVESTEGIRWGRVIVAAFLLELVLFVVLVPIGIASGAIGASAAPGNHLVFFVAVPLGCLVFGYLAGRLVVRGVSAQVVIHGLLTGVIATAIYLGLCMVGTGGLPAAIAVYGPVLFWGSNLLRIIGCTAGAAHARRL